MNENPILDSGSGAMHPSAGLTITPESRESLRVAAYWSGFLAIVGFVMMGILVLMMTFAGSALGMMMSMASGGAMGGTQLTLIYVFMAIYLAIIGFPIYYLFKFSRDTKAALRSDDTEALNSGLRYLARHYKFIGIFMVVVLCFYALIILLAIFASMAAG